MKIAVDFDGTIVEHKYPYIGREIPAAIDTLKKLSDHGHKLILWTVREGKLLEDALQFCSERGLKFFAVNSDIPGEWSGGNAARKLDVDVFIDDRNVGGLPEWSEIYEIITRRVSYAEVIGSEGHEGRGRVRHKKAGFFKRLSRRCRASRNKFNK